MLNYVRTELATGRILQFYQGAEPELQQIGEGEKYLLIEDGVLRHGEGTGYTQKVVPHPDGIRGTLVDLPPPPPPTLDVLKAGRATEIMQLRDQVIDSGITFNGVRFQTRRDDRENISGAAQLAFMAISAGAQPGDLRWHGGGGDFVWIAEDNTVIPMDAPTVLEFARATAAFKSAAIFHARSLKDSVDAAADAAALSTIDIATGWPESA